MLTHSPASSAPRRSYQVTEDAPGFIDAVLGGLKSSLKRRGLLTTNCPEEEHEFVARDASYFSQAVNLGEHVASVVEQWMRDQNEAEAVVRVWEMALEQMHLMKQRS